MLPIALVHALAAAATMADRAREAAAEVLADDAYQRALPTDPIPPQAVHLPLGPLELLVRLLLYAGLAVIVSLVAVWLWRRLSGRTRDAVAPAEAARPAPVSIPVASARALAAEGRFGEAIHALLLDTLAALSGAARLAPSLTSREIVARVPMPAPARDALSGLVTAVEVSLFGGVAPGEEEYRACLASFETFLASYGAAA